MATPQSHPPADIDRAEPGLLIANWVLSGTALVIVALRLYTRCWLKAAAGWDDFLILLAVVSYGLIGCY